MKIKCCSRSLESSLKMRKPRFLTTTRKYWEIHPSQFNPIHAHIAFSVQNPSMHYAPVLEQRRWFGRARCRWRWSSREVVRWQPDKWQVRWPTGKRDRKLRASGASRINWVEAQSWDKGGRKQKQRLVVCEPSEYSDSNLFSSVCNCLIGRSTAVSS